jgi:uncharacterized membrane protein YhhN
MKNKRIWLYAYLVLAAVELAGEALGKPQWIYFSKPFLMPMLAAWLVHELSTSRTSLRREITTGLIFATVGDTMLMFSDKAQVFFLIGLGAFLFTQLFYAGGFLSIARYHNGFVRRHPVWVAPFVLYLVVLLWILWPYTPVGLRNPVMLYGTALTIMVLSIVNLYGSIANAVFYRLLAGGLLFLASDSLLALYRFRSVFPGAHVAIMVTYITAQYLIVSGVVTLLHTRKKGSAVAA